MLTLLKEAIKPFLPYFPNSLLVSILRDRPYLVTSLRSGFVFKWPYYLDDVSMSVEIGNVIEEEILTGSYDPESSRIIRKFVKPGDVCIDVGANVGAITVLLAKQTGRTGQVLAFEPGPPYLQKLRSNLDLNPGLKGVVTIVNMGLSDKNGTLFWQADPEHPYNAGLMSSDGISVPVTTLDQYLFEHNLPRLDFVKIDVESMELEVLRGGREVLTRFQPVVLFETMDWAREARGFDIFKEIEELLDQLDYGMHDLAADGTLLDVSSIALPLNTLAIPRSTAS